MNDWYRHLLLAMLLASVHCKQLDFFVAPWQILPVIITIRVALQSSSPSAWCISYQQTRTTIKTPSKIVPLSCQPIYRINGYLQEIKRLRIRLYSPPSQTCVISPSMGLFASACIHNHIVNRYVSPIIAFTMSLDHFFSILLLQKETKQKNREPKLEKKYLHEMQKNYVQQFKLTPHVYTANTYVS